MPDRVIIPLPGIGTLELSREAYDAALRPIAAPESKGIAADRLELVSAKTLAATLSLPISCIYEYAKAGRIPCVRAGKHVRFSVNTVLDALRTTGGLTVGHS
jgi:excisionase family DNA binding protein